MRNIDPNWIEFFDVLPHWEALPLAAKKTYLTEVDAHIVPRAFLGNAYDALVEKGFLQPMSEDRDRAKPAPERAGFRRAIRAMHRSMVISARPAEEYFLGYLQDNYSQNDIVPFLENQRMRHGLNQQEAFRAITSVAWPRRFLDFPSVQMARQYEQKCNSYYRSGLYYFQTAAGFTALKDIVDWLLTKPGAVLFSDLKNQFPEYPGVVWHEALTCAVRYLIGFLSLDSENLLPTISIWPGILARDRRAAPEPPKPVAVKDSIAFPAMMEDLVVFLSGCAAEPYRLRITDGVLFAKSIEIITEQLTELPAWLVEKCNLQTGFRIQQALMIAEHLKYVEHSKDARYHHLRVTSKGMDWLGKARKVRLQVLMGAMEKSFKRTYDWDYNPLLFLPCRKAFRVAGDKVHDLSSEVISALEPLKPGEYVSLTSFIAYHRERRNPLMVIPVKKNEYIAIGSDIDRYHQPTLRSFRFPKAEELSPEDREEIWHDTLYEFLLKRMIPLGGLRLGLDEQGDLCMSMTDVGRHFLGLDPDFEVGGEEKPEIVVQPNFDVVFLAPAPAVAATIGRFAERRSRQQVGALFQITRKSIINAAASGLTTQDALQALQDSSSKSIPDNVKREITGWFEQCKKVVFRRSWIIRCPDKHTAHRVLALASRLIVPVADAVLEFVGDNSEKSALIRKMKEQGIFLDAMESNAHIARIEERLYDDY